MGRYRIPEATIGEKFGRLTILYNLGVVGKYTKVSAICECGVIKNYALGDLRKSKYPTKSCGCLNKENLPLVNIKHNLSGHPLYSVWEGMIRRCYDTKDDWYKHYGERGVTVCDDWKNDCTVFYDWGIKNGWKKGLKLDKDKLAPQHIGFCYCPEYCCFITQKENMWHRTNSAIVEYNSEKKSIAEWCDILGLGYGLIYSRIKNGWPINLAFETKVIVPEVEYKNQRKSLLKWCEILNMKYGTVYKRLSKGWEVKAAFETPADGRFKHKTITQP